MGGALEMVREMATVPYPPLGGATDMPVRPLRWPFTCAFESISRAGELAPADSGVEARPPREVVPMPAESGDDPISKTQTMLRAASESWSWDAFAYAADQEYPLATLAKFLIAHSHAGLTTQLDLDLPALDRFLLAVDALYAGPSVHPAVRVGVPRVLLPRGSGGTGGELGQGVGFVGYHNVVHACDVTQTAFALCYLGGLTAALEPLDRLALIIAAVVHDVGHPGVDNEFLNRTESVASHLWFCDAPLERFHAVTASSLMRRPEMRFHGRFPPETAEAFEAKVRALVLATDMRRHFEVIEALEGFILEVNPPPPPPTPPPERGSDDETETESEDASDDDDDGEAGAKKDLKPWEEPEEEPPELTCVSPGSVPAAAADLAAEEMRACLMTVALKAADLGHLARPLETHRDWVEALQEEFWAHGDRERAMGEEPSAPSRDRKVGGNLMGASTAAFVEQFGAPLFDAMARAMPLAATAAEAAKRNLESWGGTWPIKEEEGEGEEGGGRPRVVASQVIR